MWYTKTWSYREDDGWTLEYDQHETKEDAEAFAEVMRQYLPWDVSDVEVEIVEEED